MPACIPVVCTTIIPACISVRISACVPVWNQEEAQANIGSSEWGYSSLKHSSLSTTSQWLRCLQCTLKLDTKFINLRRYSATSLEFSLFTIHLFVISEGLLRLEWNIYQDKLSMIDIRWILIRDSELNQLNNIEQRPASLRWDNSVIVLMQFISNLTLLIHGKSYKSYTMPPVCYCVNWPIVL